jgi:hypothetical protein
MMAPMRFVLVLGLLASGGCFSDPEGGTSGSGETGGSSTGATATTTGPGSASGASSASASGDATGSVDGSGTTEGTIPEGCTDDMLGPGESDVDCGGPCPPCGVGDACSDASDCATSVCVDDVCIDARSCADLPAGTLDGLHPIDPDGPDGRPAFEVLCEMDLAGGGWTLALVSSDDGQDTWTFDDAALWTNGATLGAASEANRDLKSPAATTVPLTDLLFVHQPSGVFAAYADVVGSAVPFTAFMSTSSPSPVCGPGPGQGIAMTDGTLATGAEPAPVLWDTALYFNRGDLDGTAGSCGDLASAFNDATWGPTWNAWVFGAAAGDNFFNDPFAASFGAANPSCSMGCMPSFGGTEFNGRGFGAAIGATPLLMPAGDAVHYIQMYVR